MRADACDRCNRMSTSGFGVTYTLDHDFNRPTNEGGFHEVVLERQLEGLVRRGTVVRVQDREGEPSIKGRVRCLVAVIEPLPEGWSA